MLEQLVGVLHERYADDDEGSERDQRDRQRADERRQRYVPARDALQSHECRPRRAAEDEGPDERGKERLQDQIAARDENRQYGERDPLLDPRSLRRLLRRGRR